MTTQPLSQREFDTWRADDAVLKRQILTHMQLQSAMNLDVERRLTSVEMKQEDCAKAVSVRTTWVSSVVSAIVGGIVGAFTGGMK